MEMKAMKWTKVMSILILGLAIQVSGGGPRAVAAPVPYAGPYYQIRSVESSLCLDLKTLSKDNNIPVAQQLCGLPGAVPTSQQWRLASSGFGNYKIQNLYSGKVMDIPGGSTDNGTHIQQFQSIYAQQNQMFALDPGPCYPMVGVCSSFIRNLRSGKVLDVPWDDMRKTPGTVIQQFEKNWGSNQLWYFIEVPGITFEPLGRAEPATSGAE
jgi:ricin-type beta-trefoil lectin protein